MKHQIAASLCILLTLSACQDVKNLFLDTLTEDYQPEALAETAAPKATPLVMTAVGTGFVQPTDIQFPPGASDVAIVLEKGGSAKWLALATGKSSPAFTVPDVLTQSEQGLLGLAFHPKFASNGLFYINYVAREGSADFSRIAEWTSGGDSASENRIILKVQQPYANHNAGQLAFGPDGMLYIGWGDGGLRGDPGEHGQNPKTWLGAMLRIDVNRKDAGKEYAVPADNPFVGNAAYAPEIYAIGLRNPWRFSFDDGGRLIVADVGQDAWEEVDIVPPGANLGWNVREGMHCYSPAENCPSEGFTEPVFEYSHELGRSITGGYVYQGRNHPELRGKYIFADFITGRIWSLALPAKAGKARQAEELGKYPYLIASFGRDAAGELYFADMGSGTIFRID